MKPAEIHVNFLFQIQAFVCAAIDVDRISMVDEFYTRFRYECWSITEERTIGLAHFDQIRVHYPATAVVKVFRDKAAGHEEFRLTHFCQPLHRHILRLYAYYETRQYAVLFLEHCAGGALSDYLPSLPSLGEGVLLDMMNDIAEAVAALHFNSVVHRDLKPHNIFLTANHICKVGDLETVKELVNYADLHSMTRGTIAYMSPEKVNFMGHRDLEPKRAYLDDIWALGKTFFEMGIGQVDMKLANVVAQGHATLHSYIYTHVRQTGRSEGLAALIEDMLTSSDTSAKDECSSLSRLKFGVIQPILAHNEGNDIPKCALCTEQQGLIDLPCKHSYCLSHFSQHLSACLSSVSTTLLSHITCLHCNSPIPYQHITRGSSHLPPELQAKLRRVDSLSASAKCACGQAYPLVCWKNESANSYVRKCTKCGLKACSWCGAKGGHGFFTSTSKCPAFPY